MPTKTAAAGRITAQPALAATSPATQPLAQSELSTLPKRVRVMLAATSAAEAADSVIFSATKTVRLGSIPANRIAPAESNPSQPNQASQQPNRTRTVLCPGMAAGILLGVYFPRRGPRIHAMARAVNPPTAWMEPAPPQSTNPLPSAPICPRRATQPPPQAQCANKG